MVAGRDIRSTLAEQPHDVCVDLSASPDNALKILLDTPGRPGINLAMPDESQKPILTHSHSVGA